MRAISVFITRPPDVVRFTTSGGFDMAFFLGWFTEKERREKMVAGQRAWGANHAVARSLLSVPEGAVQAWRCGGTFTIKTV